MITTKLYQKLFKAYCSKDKIRQNIYQTVFHDDKLAAQVFTDGYCAAILPSFYDAKFAGISIRVEDMHSSIREFPSLSAINPDLSKYQSGSIFLDLVCGKSTDKKPLPVFWNGEKFTYEQGDNSIFSINSRCLSPMLLCSVKIFWLDDKAPIVFSLDEGTGDKVIIMPYKLAEKV